VYNFDCNYLNLLIHCNAKPLNGLQEAMLTSLLHIEKRKALGNPQKEDIKTIGDMMEFIKRFQ